MIHWLSWGAATAALAGLSAVLVAAMGRLGERVGELERCRDREVDAARLMALRATMIALLDHLAEHEAVRARRLRAAIEQAGEGVAPVGAARADLRAYKDAVALGGMAQLMRERL